MPDWDADSPQLRENLARVLRGIRDEARLRPAPALAAARRWHAEVMRDLSVPDPHAVGRFRGETGLERIEVRVGPRPGVAASEVAAALDRFERALRDAALRLDELLQPGAVPDADRLAAVVDLCAFAHAEWVRIHPFVNGNGRTARLWANALAMRYGVPPFVRLRPRPDDGYAAAGAAAMDGDWRPTATVFRRMLRRFLAERGGAP